MSRGRLSTDGAEVDVTAGAGPALVGVGEGLVAGSRERFDTPDVGVEVCVAPTTVGDVPTVGVATAVPVGVEVGEDVGVTDGVPDCDGLGSESIDAENFGVKKTSTK